jgi:electron transfer flavoprotein alpha/beta subunit
MKILVCISKTPDTTAKIAFTDNNTKFASEGVQWIINPYDDGATVGAIELKKKILPAIHLNCRRRRCRADHQTLARRR